MTTRVYHSALTHDCNNNNSSIKVGVHDRHRTKGGPSHNRGNEPRTSEAKRTSSRLEVEDLVATITSPEPKGLVRLGNVDEKDCRVIACPFRARVIYVAPSWAPIRTGFCIPRGAINSEGQMRIDYAQLLISRKKYRLIQPSSLS